MSEIKTIAIALLLAAPLACSHDRRGSQSPQMTPASGYEPEPNNSNYENPPTAPTNTSMPSNQHAPAPASPGMDDIDRDQDRTMDQSPSGPAGGPGAGPSSGAGPSAPAR